MTTKNYSWIRGLTILMFFVAWLLYPIIFNSDNILFPSLIDVVKSLIDLFFDISFYKHILISIIRITLGFGIAAIFGLFVGYMAGVFKLFETIVLPITSALRYIPPTAFIGLIIVWFGIGEVSKILIIFIGVFFFVVQMTYDIVKLVPHEFYEAGIIFNATRLEMIKKIVLPYTLPEIIAVLRINFSAAWTFLVVAEVIVAQNGIGYLMSTSQRFLNVSTLFALIIITGLIGYVCDYIIGILIRRKAVWK